MPVILIGNHKGGVGKTTVTAGFAAGYAMRGRQVICVDLDPQANLTSRFAYRDEDARQLIGRSSIADAIAAASPQAFAASLVPCQWEPDWADNIQLSPGHTDLHYRETETGSPTAWGRLERALADVDPETVVLLDVPPSMGHLFGLAVAAADHIVAVSAPELDSITGVVKINQYIEESRAFLGSRATGVDGVVINNRRRSYVHELRSEQLVEAFGDKVWQPPLKQNAAVLDNNERAQAPQFGHKPTAKIFDEWIGGLDGVIAARQAVPA